MTAFYWVAAAISSPICRGGRFRLSYGGRAGPARLPVALGDDRTRRPVPGHGRSAAVGDDQRGTDRGVPGPCQITSMMDSATDVGAWLPWSVATDLSSRAADGITYAHSLDGVARLSPLWWPGCPPGCGGPGSNDRSGNADGEGSARGLRARGLIERVGRTRRLSAPLLAGAQSTGVPVIDRPTRHHGRGSRRREPSRPEGEERRPIRNSRRSPVARSPCWPPCWPRRARC